MTSFAFVADPVRVVNCISNLSIVAAALKIFLTNAPIAKPANTPFTPSIAFFIFAVATWTLLLAFLT